MWMILYKSKYPNHNLMKQVRRLVYIALVSMVMAQNPWQGITERGTFTTWQWRQNVHLYSLIFYSMLQSGGQFKSPPYDLTPYGKLPRRFSNHTVHQGGIQSRTEMWTVDIFFKSNCPSKVFFYWLWLPPSQRLWSVKSRPGSPVHQPPALTPSGAWWPVRRRRGTPWCWGCRYWRPGTTATLCQTSDWLLSLRQTLRGNPCWDWRK